MPWFETSERTTLFYTDWGTSDPATADLRSDMAAFTVPPFIVHGAADPFTAVEATAVRTARAIPGNQLTVYVGASHGLYFTHRDRLNADLLAFIWSKYAVRAAR
jgi:non-heme chloroperoxidase